MKSSGESFILFKPADEETGRVMEFETADAPFETQDICGILMMIMMIAKGVPTAAFINAA